MATATMTEQSPLMEVDGGRWPAFGITFSMNGRYLVSGGKEGVRVWRVNDGKEVAMFAAELVECLAVSNDGRLIAAGTVWGWVFVWDVMTHKQVFSHKEDSHNINGVEFSPDSTRLAVASDNRTVVVWNIAILRPVLGPLPHEDGVRAVKYSLQGDRIATATGNSVRVYDSIDGRLLSDIPAKYSGSRTLSAALLWSNDQLFIACDGEIRQVETSSPGSVVAKWPVPDAMNSPCVALPQHGKFIAHSANRTVTFWNASTHVQLAVLIQHCEVICSVALSPDARLLAIGGNDGKITVKSLPDIIDSLPSSVLHSTLREPDIHIDDAILELWSNDKLADAQTLLTEAVADSRNAAHLAFASRALVRARLRHLDGAIDDAKKSIKIQPSVIGYIAKSVAFVADGKIRRAYRTCDIAFEHFHSTHVTFILLIKAIIVFMAGEQDDAIYRLEDLIATFRFNSIFYVIQAYMYLFIGNACMESSNYQDAIQSFEHARSRMRNHTSRPLLVISLISGWKFDDLAITIRRRLCEAQYAAGRTKDAVKSLLDMVNTFGEEVYMSGPTAKWVSDFTCQCLFTPESDTEATPIAIPHNKATALHSNPDSTAPNSLLKEWAKSSLASGEWKDALVAAVGFTVPRFMVYRVICEHLEMTDRLTNAVDCLHQMDSELARETITHDGRQKWVVDFKRRCSERLEDLGDTAMSGDRHDDAISQYSAALSLDPAVSQGLLTKRSKAYLAKGLWKDALDDANKAITSNPSSPWGYERKHAALHKARDYESAINAFEAMLLKISQSPEPDIRERHRQYVNPKDTKAVIHRIVQDAIRDMPRVLINTMSGRLVSKSEQATAFELLPGSKELVSSMTTEIDHARIERDVKQYYRYAMLSHTWEENEPLFDQVIRIVVYDLEASPTHDKLRMFCKTVKEAGLHWAWSDTCCINKTDHFVLQEALVAMFKWYEGSAVTLVLLRGVHHPSQRGDLVKSIWNTRAWTFQEYHASKVIQFYTEDWTLYLNLNIANHKGSLEIISEMEEATGISAQALMALRPGLDDIREKLYLASQREATFVEDSAYSLLGIFSATLPVVYGEGDKALGRLLAQLLTSSGDTGILAWTGRSGSFNSCLPANITVFGYLSTTHIPPAMKAAEMEVTTAGLRVSLNLSLAMKLYDRLNELPVPLFVGQRIKLPCIVFKLGSLSTSRSGSEYVFRAQTFALGVVEIRTKEDLSRLDSLHLIHPWIDFLLDRQPVGNVAETIPEESTNDHTLISGSSTGSSNSKSADPQARTAWLASRLASVRQFGGRPPRDVQSLRPPSTVLQADKQMRALQLMARLRQPFGALLLTPNLGGVAAYRRVAAESLITVQVEENMQTIAKKLVESVRIWDVL